MEQIIGGWLAKMDPGQFSLSTLVWAVVVFLGLFTWKKAWPWYIEQGWPDFVRGRDARLAAEAKREQDNLDALRKVADALIEIKVVVGQQLIMIQQHDQTARAGIANMVDLQTQALEKMGVSVPKPALTAVKSVPTSTSDVTEAAKS
jgi:hypothetical protein